MGKVYTRFQTKVLNEPLLRGVVQKFLPEKKCEENRISFPVHSLSLKTGTEAEAIDFSTRASGKKPRFSGSSNSLDPAMFSMESFQFVILTKT